MKNVLVLMHDDAGQEARFQAAVDLTRALDGHLTCIDIAIAPVFVGDYADCGGTALLMADEEQREGVNRTRMEARLRVEGVPYDWIDEKGFLTPCVCDSTALADLVVLNRELDSIPYPDMRELVGDLLVKTGKPIVAVPENAKGFDAFGHALVAWDGSEQAEAALRAAVPLLQHAGTVTILEVDDGSIKLPASEAAEYLSRHGIKPIVRRESAREDIPSTVLLDTIEAVGAAYLVMGGFGHRRFIEAAFGGVTKRMLKECPVPLFIAH
ncbi:universal stress protein [Sphingomonas cannabina]|uniref:universal stress protein n=1 Tax=Sphingomonas cannabina TaxID=2899123 RepID=UPI001F3DDEA6|nr:universal stress protein [Sphingomonas cannabina]UIJ46318.1 universal stress protein [Sphingomonas cannabina]